MSAIDALPAPHAAPARDGRRAPDSLSAWRQAFDREQMAALDKFRSVKAPGFAAVSSRGGAAPVAASDVNSSLATAGTAAASRPASGPAANSVRGQQAQAAWLPAARLSSRQLPPPPSQALSGRSSAGPAPLAVQTESKSGVANDIRTALPAGMLARWPWRKLHCMADADGLHLWLRDADATQHDPALQRWLRELGGALAAAGTPLRSFTLNGRDFPLPSIVL